MIKTGNMIITHLKSFFKHLNSFLKLFSILVGQTFAVIKFSIGRHKFDGTIKILMSEINFSESKISISSVEQSTSIIRIKSQSFIILWKTFIIKLVVIKRKSFIVIVSWFWRILFNSFLKSLKCHIILLILEKRKTKIVLSRRIISIHFACLS